MWPVSLRRQTEALKLLREIHASHHQQLPGGSKPKPIAQRARESLFSRIVDILSQTIAIEQDLNGRLSEDLWSLIRKDSIELKNISVRMSLSETALQNDKNLRELRICLQIIVTNLLSVLRDNTHPACSGAVGRLMGISISFPDQ